MARSTESLLLERQLKLDRQRQILEQKRKTKHQQIHTGMITASGIGSQRPTSGKSRKLSSDVTLSLNNSTSSNSAVPLSSVSNLPSSSVPSSSVSSVPSSSVPSVSSLPGVSNVPSSNVIYVSSSADSTNLTNNTPINEETDNPNDIEMISPSINSPSFEEQPLPPLEEDKELISPTVSLSQKLTAMGLTSEVNGNTSDSSDDERNDVKLKEISPAYEVSVEPSVTPPPPLKNLTAPPENKRDTNPLKITYNDDGTIFNLSEVVFRAPPVDEVIHCRVTRDKQGLDKHYYLHLEKDNVRKVFLLAGNKKRKARSAYYTISIDPTDLSKHSNNFVAKLRSNFVGTSFTVYDNGAKPPTTNLATLREELVLITYETNVLGFKGPRRMSVIIPELDKECKRIPVKPIVESETLFECSKNGNTSHLYQLHNKQPVWSEDTQAYVLNFRGRVTQASVKNFQLVLSSDEDYLVLQFGRIAEDIFTLDYRFPMCAVQAFGIALSSFDSKWACE